MHDDQRVMPVFTTRKEAVPHDALRLQLLGPQLLPWNCGLLQQNCVPIALEREPLDERKDSFFSGSPKIPGHDLQMVS